MEGGTSVPGRLEHRSLAPPGIHVPMVYEATILYYAHPVTDLGLPTIHLSSICRELGEVRSRKGPPHSP